jgi:hypothetical protein
MVLLLSGPERPGSPGTGIGTGDFDLLNAGTIEVSSIPVKRRLDRI